MTTTLRRDHVAGGIFVLGGSLVLAVSGDLPFGTLASPGAGMLPTLVAALMIAFGVMLLAGAQRSAPIGEINWTDLPHAVRVALIAAAAVALYMPLGFILTTFLLLFTLIFLVERRPFLPAIAFSAGAVLVVYVLFSMLLRTPLPSGLLGF